MTLFGLSTKERFDPLEIEVRFAGLIVHDPQRTVRQAVDPVGQAPEDHTQGFSGAFERKLLPDPLLESFDRKIVMRGVVRQYAAPNIADYNIFDQQQITAIILNRRFNILQIVFIDGRNYRLLHFGRTGQRTQRLSAAGLPDKGSIEPLQSRMENRTEHRCIDLLRNLVVRLQPGHGVKIEAQGTSHIPEKSRRRQPHGIVRREEASQLFGGFPLLGDLDRRGFHPIDIDTDLPAEDLEGSFVLQLIDVTALFAGGLVVGMSAIEHPHVLGPLQQTIKIVGVNPLVMLRRRQGISRPQVVGNERSTGHDTAWKVVVVHREQNDVAEIEVAGFEDTHNLNSLQRLSLVRNTQGLQMSAKK